ncbi:MAG: DUF763 domain-containing protein [Candidatus Omnitrophica bacterium]|nr:DUF763 domain-containing protein [Candidatus Omnitrophota bacterium]
MKKGYLDLPLHGGRCPRWLFEKMKVLARGICEAIIWEFGLEYLLHRLADPFWFQSLGCLLGFDWHSSGLTTTVCGALKEAFTDLEEYGVYICGGKGLVSRSTPQEIERISQKIGKDPAPLIFASRMVAKVDNSALQDGFNLYHHTFIFTHKFNWVVIQQGMSSDYCWARRYHWYSQKVTSFVEEPHLGVVSDKSFLTLNLVDKDRGKLRSLVTELSQRKTQDNIKDIGLLKTSAERLPSRHRILLEDINPQYLHKVFLTTYMRKPKDFESLLGLEGVGLKTLRALALISDLIYGESVSFKDPARFSFAHGGKDGYPYKISLGDYQKTIDSLARIVNKAKLERGNKIEALRRLYKFYQSLKGKEEQ